MEAIVSLKLRIGLDGLTESPLIHDQTALEAFIRDNVAKALSTVTSPGDGKETVITAAKAGEISVLTGGAPSGQKATVLLRQVGSVALDEVPDLSGVLCIPVWAAPSDKLPDMLLFVRPVSTNQESDAMVVRMQAGQAMATILRKQADLYEQLIQGHHSTLHELGARIEQQQTRLAGLMAAVADSGTQPPNPTLAEPNAS